MLLGTGTPIADWDRHGPSTAVAFRGRGLVVDAGPGVVRRLAEAAQRHAQPALDPGNVRTVLLTHLHSDHTTGLPDLLLGGWVLGRSLPVEVIGPPGTRALVDGILSAWSYDRSIRQAPGGEELPRRGIDVVVREIEEDGVVLDTGGLVVRAFHVPHGIFEHAFGYRLEVDGRSVVISGDTDKSDAVAKACGGCDLLIHEAYSARGYAAVDSPSFHHYHGTFHTSAVEVGEVATAAGAKEVVLYHQLFFGDSAANMVEEVRTTFAGPVRSGVDLQRL